MCWLGVVLHARTARLLPDKAGAAMLHLHYRHGAQPIRRCHSVFSSCQLRLALARRFSPQDTPAWHLPRTWTRDSRPGREPSCWSFPCQDGTCRWPAATVRSPRPAPAGCVKRKCQFLSERNPEQRVGEHKPAVIADDAGRAAAERSQVPGLARLNGGATRRSKAHAGKICKKERNQLVTLNQNIASVVAILRENAHISHPGP